MIRAFFVLLTLGIFVLMVKLGFWQLSRAEEKTQWQAQLDTRMAARPMSFGELIALAEKGANPSGYRFALTASALPGPILLLDNQVLDGTVGYLAYQLFEISPQSPKLLVELGFIKAPVKRSELPQIPKAQGQLYLEGKVYRKEANPLSSALLPDTQSPVRIQNLNFPELQTYLNTQVLPLALQPDELAQVALPRPWHPIPMPPEKHLGYAVQWFSMATALLLMSIFFVLRNRYRKSD